MPDAPAVLDPDAPPSLEPEEWSPQAARQSALDEAKTAATRRTHNSAGETEPRTRIRTVVGALLPIR
jgi:hypothetical protein